MRFSVRPLRCIRPLFAAALAVLVAAGPPLATDPVFAADAPGGKSEYRVGDRLPQKGAAKSAAGFREIKWDDLVPSSWDPRKIFEGIDLRMLEDSDPRAIKALEKLREVWNNAPANADLNGERIRLPGFVVPLERKGRLVTEFLLVPYFGACIHTPPPPANQIIHVVAGKPLKDVQTMDAVWTQGVLEVARSETGLGNASYRMKAQTIEPYRRK